MKKVYYLFLLLLVLSIFTSCSTESTPVYQLTTSAEPAEAGAVTPGKGEYDEGEQLQITATANENWIFDRWSGDQTDNTNPASITMNSDKSIKALFIKREYPLTVITEGEGTVSESIVQGKTTDYPHGTTVELKANPADGWEFVEWLGDLEGDVNPSNVIVEGEKSVIAVFQEAVYTIEFKIEGEGDVKIDPLKDIYEFGEIVTLTVEPAEGWSFIHWSGDLEGSKNPYEISMSQNLDIIVALDENPFAGGNGSMEYPYLISTIEQLQAVRNYINKHFLQLNNIDASFTKNWNNGKGFEPIGDEILEFKGEYDGNNYSINNLYINDVRVADLGLFGITNYASIKNVVLNNVYIYGTRVGGLIGRSFMTNVENVTVNAKSLGPFSSVGGIVGNMSGGELNNVTVNVIDTLRGHWAGGIVGSASNGVINNSSFKGFIDRSSNGGGIVGQSWDSKINKSISRAKIVVENTGGGIVGQARGTNSEKTEINQSSSHGEIRSSNDGIIGGAVGEITGYVNIIDVYSHADTYGDRNVGGFVGVNGENGSIITSYSTGKVNGLSDTGGFAGVNAGEIINSYWNKETSNFENAIGRGANQEIDGLTTSEMLGSTAKENMSDFDWVNIWKITNKFPHLKWQD